MSINFLIQFVEVARRVSGAERAFAVTPDLQVCAYSQMDEAALSQTKFREFALEAVRSAYQQNQPLFTNNLIQDMAQAPTTNTNLAEMRFVVALPIAGVGAIYLDQPIRQGVIARDKVERLHAFALEALAGEAANLPADEMERAFHA